MLLIKDGQTISLDNVDHINAFLGSGWAEVKASAPASKAEVKSEKAEPKAEDVKASEEKKAVSKKKQEK